MRTHSPAERTLAALLAAHLLLGGLPATAAAAATRVEHEAPDFYVPGFRVNLTAEIEDDAGILVARCYFRSRNDPTFAFVEMAATRKERYRATLPAPWLGSQEIEYVFVVVNKGKKVFRSQPYRVPEKQTKQLKKWQEAKEVREVRLDRLQEIAEDYAALRASLLDEWRRKRPEWQEDPGIELEAFTDLEAGRAQLAGFLDRVVVRQVPDYLRYGLLVDGLYTPAAVAEAGGAAAAATATGAGSAGAAAGGGSSWLLWTLGGLAVVGGGAAAVVASGAADDIFKDEKNVKDAAAQDFVGTFDASDPARPLSQYRAVFVFNGGGTGTVTEYVAGKTLTSNLTWKFNDASDMFSFAVPGGGSFKGHVTGTTKEFTATGTWANGAAGSLRMKRR